MCVCKPRNGYHLVTGTKRRQCTLLPPNLLWSLTFLVFWKIHWIWGHHAHYGKLSVYLISGWLNYEELGSGYISQWKWGAGDIVGCDSKSISGSQIFPFTDASPPSPTIVKKISKCVPSAYSCNMWTPLKFTPDISPWNGSNNFIERRRRFRSSWICLALKAAPMLRRQCMFKVTSSSPAAERPFFC